MYSLESHFKSVCDAHPHLKLLESQWRFDEELISKALQNVSAMFPHYSRHDASHSRQIIVNIERMLGKKVQYLTATDTWLIMEAAYNHDVGMVVTSKQLQDMDTAEFDVYVSDIISQPSHPLRGFAEDWVKERARLPTGADSHVFFSQYTQLVAEWFRRKHPQNSAKVVRNPVDEIGLNSPRNELLPKRLFGILAEVCRVHGESFQQVMNLPFAEAGMASEDCHPRYVACLLRMADLLDLDDNRFCPVMINMCGGGLPGVSHSHLEKHHSIKHFRLDAERIEVESECPSPASYEIAFEWFGWLTSEYYNQTQFWDRIVPSQGLGNLPTLATPVVTIKEPFLILEQGKKPNFKIDQDAVLDLLRSTGLYSSKFDSIREVMQNAVDASLIAAWLENKTEILRLSPIDRGMQSILDAYEIKVEIEHDNSKFLIFRVSDKGTGVDFETLKYMLEVGSSSKNKPKRKIIEEMPAWYRPSGNFGIGLQSLYLISDRFKIRTKSRLTHEALSIDFSKKKEKSVVIKKLSPTSVSYGTEIEIIVKVKKFPKSISLESWDKSDSLSVKLNEYDFTQPNSDLRCYERIKISNAIAKFGVNSPVPINFSSRLERDFDESFFCKKTNVILQYVHFLNADSANIQTFFRGQAVSGFKYILSGCSCAVDFHGHFAKDFLTYNREKILPQAQITARENVIESLLNYIDEKFSEIPVAEKSNAAAFRFIYSSNDSDDEVGRYLMSYSVRFSDGSNKSLQQVLDQIEDGSLSSISSQKFSHESRGDGFLTRNSTEMALSLIIHFAVKRGLYYQLERGVSLPEEPTYAGPVSYIWNRLDVVPISTALMRELLLQKNDETHGIGVRVMFPCWGDYRKLAIRADVPWARKYRYRSSRNEFMVLPCLFNNKNEAVKMDFSDDFVKWVFNNRKVGGVTFDEIATLYKNLSEYLAQVIQSAAIVAA